MPAPRLPAAKAKVTGAEGKNPQRHRNRVEPSSKPLGDAPSFLDGFGVQAWEGFKRELPWLLESDRAVMEVCAQVRGLLLAGEDVGVTKLSMYQSVLSKLGATPADRTKIGASSDEDEDDDILDS